MWVNNPHPLLGPLNTLLELIVDSDHRGSVTIQGGHNSVSKMMERQWGGHLRHNSLSYMHLYRQAHLCTYMQTKHCKVAVILWLVSYVYIEIFFSSLYFMPYVWGLFLCVSRSLLPSLSTLNTNIIWANFFLGSESKYWVGSPNSPAEDQRSQWRN